MDYQPWGFGVVGGYGLDRVCGAVLPKNIRL